MGIVIVDRYCRRCNGLTPQRSIGVVVAGSGEVSLYKCLYCYEQNRAPIPKTALELNLTEDKMKQNRLLEGKNE